VRRGGNQGQLVVYQLAQTEEEKNQSDNFAGSESNFAGASRALRGPEKNDESPAMAQFAPSTSRPRDYRKTFSIAEPGAKPVLHVVHPNLRRITLSS
jgi:hypothetical protein